MGSFKSQHASFSQYILLIWSVLLLSAQVGFSSSCYKRIFAFGDSIIDTGNFMHSMGDRPDPIKEYPFGMTFFTHPTGRISDGRVLIDFYAQALGLPLIPPSLPEKGKEPGQFPVGANFAVFGATALPPEYFKRWNHSIPGSVPLGVQLQEFKETLQRIAPGDEAKKLLSESLILLGEIGGNDYNFWLMGHKQPRDQAKEFIPDIVATISKTAEELINLGAKTIVIPGNFPSGCVPGYLANFPSTNTLDYDEFKCLKWYNDLSKSHNLALSNEVNKLKAKHPDVKLIFADYFGASMEFVKNPKNYGIGDPLVASCGGIGPYHTGKPCDKNAILWGNPLNFASWDGLHLTEKAYNVIADGVLHGPFADPPLLQSC